MEILQSKKLRIALFFSSNPSSTGGVQEHVMYLSDELRKAGHDVTIFGPEGKSNQYKNYKSIGYTVQVPLPNGNWASVQMLKPFTDVKKIISKERFDIFHIQEPYIPFLSWHLIEHIDIPKVSTFHSAWDQESVMNALNNILPMFADKFSQHMDGAIFVSHITKKRWKSLCKKNVIQKVMYNAVDRQLFYPIDKNAESTIKILFLGRIVPRKGIMYLLNSFKTLLPDHPNIHLDIVGGGADVEKTIDFIKKNNLEKQIQYHGEIFGTKRIAFFQNADIFCAPYCDEASPLTILEAMSCGCTLVGFQNEAVKESLKGYPEFKKLFVQQKNSQALTNALQYTISSADTRKNSRQWCLKESRKYSWRKVAQKTIGIYHNIIKKHHA
ncbi:MAG: glycosyltransferase family 4 protein [Patescibacteria group bacterium]